MTTLARRALLPLLLGAAAGAAGTGGRAALANDQQRVVDQARIVVEEFLEKPEYEKMRLYVQNAYGVLVVPDLLKGGFIVGGEYGTGVILGRDPQTGAPGVPAEDGGTTTDILEADNCVSWLGPNQPGINEDLNLPKYDPSVCPNGTEPPAAEQELCSPADPPSSRARAGGASASGGRGEGSGGAPEPAAPAPGDATR